VAFSRIPIVAIGSINLDNLPEVLAAGAQNLAMIRGILDHEDPSFPIQEIQRQLLYNQGITHE